MGIIGDLAKGIGNNPIIGAALVVGIPLFLFRKQIGEFFNPVGAAVEDFGQGLTDAIDSTGQFFNDVGQQAGEAIGGAGESVGSVVGNAQSGIVGDIDAVNAGFGDFFKGIGDFFGSLGGLIPQAQPEVQGPIQNIPDERPTNLAGFIPPVNPYQNQADNPINNQIVQSEIEDQQFLGGGPSFIGGVVRETPIQFLSLNQIIERFGVTASQAANIRATAQNNFGDFDFGTNTGSGIGSVIENIPELQNVGSVSDPRFEGMTAQEIALRLTGGNINNF